MDSAVDPYRHYPDLNNSVYPTQTVAPLRTPEEVKGVLRQRAQRGPVSVAEWTTRQSTSCWARHTYIKEVLSGTGGIGHLLPLHVGGLPTKHRADEFLRQFATQPAVRKVMLRLFCDSGRLEGQRLQPGDG